MDVEIHTQTVSDLVAALEQATLMAKQLSTTTDPPHLLQIHATLLSAQRHLSLYLSAPHPPPPPPPQESSFSGGGEPMDMGDGDGEQDSKATVTSVDKVEERMRECFIRKKRAKRALSPSAAAAPYENGGGVAADLDPVGNKLRSLDLIYQFHA